jgi:hypothetical protein
MIVPYYFKCALLIHFLILDEKQKYLEYLKINFWPSSIKTDRKYKLF